MGTIFELRKSADLNTYTRGSSIKINPDKFSEAYFNTSHKLSASQICPENPNHNMIRWDHISGTRGRGKKRKWLHPFIFLPLSSGASA